MRTGTLQTSRRFDLARTGRNDHCGDRHDSTGDCYVSPPGEFAWAGKGVALYSFTRSSLDEQPSNLGWALVELRGGLATRLGLPAHLRFRFHPQASWLRSARVDTARTNDRGEPRTGRCGLARCV